MRKLTILAAAAVAAAALMAAAPAQADEPFQVTGPFGVPCNPLCEDSVYEGTIELKTLEGHPLDHCFTRFDVQVEPDGSLVAHYPGYPGYPPHVDCYYSIHACGNSWPGQIEVPDSGLPPRIDLSICLNGNTPITHNVTFEIYDGPRLWAQYSPDSYTGVGYIADTYFDDVGSGDDFVVDLL